MEQSDVLKECIKCPFYEEVGEVKTCIRGGILVGDKKLVSIKCPIGKGKKEEK